MATKGTAMQLEHDELLLLARLSHHLGGNGMGPMDPLMTKLWEYADRMGEKLEPLQLEETTIAGAPSRLGFRLTTLAPGK